MATWYAKAMSCHRKKVASVPITAQATAVYVTEDNPRALPDFVGSGAEAVALPVGTALAGTAVAEAGVAGIELVVLGAAAELTASELAVAELAGAAEEEATKTSVPNTI